ncbi:condensation domain-containing protein [Amycolatopsis sp. PS_44_ISF1]|uniref:condensation domain-containing protein n=1 Tax=Amycolatopsis sp. PS_44_ISF1 TaxID=2974917 RepID=UPI0028DF1EF5|nr:condensation domain-containing protein [Amycolatopsis sp. PS_44_ISF1]MDT8911803.1 condensation domain-containing protein [Amycolatopsis sp. PS_44_ISF1]MDT8916378.1 condensation domain-containing protein [Amycolatopsis sp. PS_44_ISF1]
MRQSDEQLSFGSDAAKRETATWSQRLLWNDAQWLMPDDAYFNIEVEVPLPGAVSRRQVLDAMGLLLSRHDTLRTQVYLDDSGELLQDVVKTGSVPVRVERDEDPDSAAKRILKEMRTSPFRFPGELPLRIAVLEDGAAPRRLLMVLSHILFDRTGVDLLTADLERLVSNAELPGPGVQPVSRAVFERSAEGAELSERAVGLWLETMASAPPSTFDGSLGKPAELRFVRVEMASPAAATALELLSSRLNVTNSTVLLSSVATVLAAITGRDTILFKLIVGNRFLPGLAELAGITVGNALVAVKTNGCSLSEIAAVTSRSYLNAQAHAQCDPVRLAEAIRSADRRRGAVTRFGTFFNDSRLSRPEAVSEAEPSIEDAEGQKALTRIRTVAGWQRQNLEFFFEPYSGADCEVFSVIVDTELVSEEHAHEFLRTLESLLLKQLRSDTGVEAAQLAADAPAPGPEGRWMRKDGILVDLRVVEEIVRAVSACPRAFAVCEDGELIAYIPSPAAGFDPMRLHRSVMAQLARSRRAAAPDRYVQLVSESGERVVLAAGSGRD